MTNEWDKPSDALKRIAAAKTPEQFRRCVSCGHRHAFTGKDVSGAVLCSEICGCKREVLEP